MKTRRATEPMSRASVTPNNDMMLDQTKSQKFAKKDGRSGSYRIAADTSRMHTPRFTAKQHFSSTMTIDQSEICVTPGPSDYETGVNSCLKERSKQTSFTTATRFN